MSEWLIPISLNWQSIDVMVDNTRVVLFQDAPERWGVIVFDSNDTMHQLPIMPTEKQAQEIRSLLCKELRAR